MNKFPSDEAMLKRIVRAIEKAVTEDVPLIHNEYPMETSNFLKYVKGDAINNNLKKIVISDNVKFIKFKRNSWNGRMLVDNKNHITYSITTQQNLYRISRKKERRSPHFLQSVLAIENGDLQTENVQQTLYPMEMFTEDILRKDYDEIVSGYLDPNINYHHYIIVYSFDKYQLLDISMQLLDKDFNIIEEISMNEFIKPDFSQLTAEQNENIHPAEPAANARSLIALKPGIQLQILEDKKKNES